VKAADKIAPLDVVGERTRTDRTQGRSVVLANGIFDLLHVGHVRYLEGAKELADVLVVAVNSDRSAAMSKGSGRPVVPERERAELIAAMHCVDHVLIFDEPDVRAVIRALRPEVHAKGTDYTRLTVPERNEVESYGGRVEIVGDDKRHSSTELIARLTKLRRSSP
jgi:D-glycero-beta-D-manno-heptose 1-phosphate adenylyltransferase